MSGYQPPAHAGPIADWPHVEYDASLHLLDRQIVDLDGQMVGKVDDVELTRDVDGAWVPTGLLVGAPALLRRFGGRLGPWLLDHYVDARAVHAGRGRPGVIELDVVDTVTSEVHLSVRREGVLEPRANEPAAVDHHARLADVLGLPVAAEEGVDARGRVLDVRLGPTDEHPDRQQILALVVGPGRPGSLLGYDRRDQPGPVVLSKLVRWLHRHARVVLLGRGVELDLDARVVRVGREADVRPLRSDRED